MTNVNGGWIHRKGEKARRRKVARSQGEKAQGEKAQRRESFNQAQFVIPSAARDLHFLNT